MPEGRHAADRITGRDARRLGVGLGRRIARHGGEAGLIEPVGAADKRDHRSAARDEDERLHDLTDVASHRARGIAGGASALWELLDHHAEVGGGKPRLKSIQRHHDRYSFPPCSARRLGL